MPEKIADNFRLEEVLRKMFFEWNVLLIEYEGNGADGYLCTWHVKF